MPETADKIGGRYIYKWKASQDTQYLRGNNVSQKNALSFKAGRPLSRSHKRKNLKDWLKKLKIILEIT